MDELAGRIGILPDSLTYGRLLTMADAREREQWRHTATLTAELLNGPSSRRDHRRWRASDIDPFAERETVQQRVSPTEMVRALAAIWL